VRLSARVPATSANLGPGFDCFALALELCNEVIVDTDAEPGVTWEGEGARELPTDGTDLISRAMRHVEGLASGSRRPLPAFHLHGVNRIPLASGLGSSSAAAVAGAALASVLVGVTGDDLHGVFRVAAELEGHPDNAAAAVFGGFTLAMPDGAVRRLEPHPDLRPVVWIPSSERLPTEEARRALPPTVPLIDAVHNVAHAALMVEALTRDPSVLATAMRDRLHQDARLALVPSVRAMFDRLQQAGVPVCVSGAGPSLLSFEREGHPMPAPAPGWRSLRIPVRAAGVEVTRG